MAEKYLKSEVETYDQYLTGDVYGYVIEDKEGEELDSCWGFYGEEYCLEEAKSIADWHANDIAEKKAAFLKNQQEELVSASLG